MIVDADRRLHSGPVAGERDAALARPRPRPWLNALFLGAAFLAFRLPSLLEPAWYSDEGTYADIGRALLHGAVLYRDVWDNKPPAIYWLAAAVISMFGPGALAFAVVLTLIVAGSAVAAWRLGRHSGGVATATVATLLVIVLMSLPNLQGDVLNAELVGAAAVLWAMVLITARGMRRWHAVLAGGLLALAFLAKGVFIVDIAAALAIPLWLARSSRKPWRTALPIARDIAAGLLAVLSVTTIVLASTGSIGGLIDVLLRQDVDYVQLANGPNGAVLTSITVGSRALFTLLLLLRVAVPLIGLGLTAWWASRNGFFWAAVLAWWLGCDLAGAMVSDRGFSHYAQQAVGPLAIGAALIATALWRRRGAARPAAVLLVLLTWPVLELTLILPRAEVALAQDRPFPQLEVDNFRTPQVGEYYRLSWEELTGTVSQRTYEAFFPTDLERLRAVVDLFRHYSRPGDRVFVWGIVHWAYAVSDRLPAGRYVSLNPAYAVDPGAQPRLIAELTEHPPAVLIADVALPAPALDLLQRLHYQRLAGAAAGADAWIAPGTARASPG
jgi:Dolichyl-phosphate-mannose-protein mannosyltransferase